MKKTKHKTLRRTVLLILLAALVVLLAVMPLLASRKRPAEEYPRSVLAAQGESREVSRYLAAGGVLEEETGEEITIPAEVKLTEFLVENGDIVSPGDPIAKVDRVTVMAAIASTQEAMADIAKELETVRADTDGDTIRAPGGLVKHIYGKPGDKVEDVMLTYGALAVISLDEKMAVTVEADCGLLSGDSVTVLLDQTELTGTVEMNRSGVLTVTIPDKGYEAGTQVILSLQDGTSLGQGVLTIHNPWNAVAYSGTVDRIYGREGQTIRSGNTLLTLKETGFSAEYRALAAEHRALETQMTELFSLYQNLTLTAPVGGVVSGIDENSAQLLSGRGGWQVTLLANSPDGKEDAQYLNFVGQVKEQGTDGWIIRVNPQFLDITDYSDLSAVPRDPAAMTREVLYLGGAPVYQWIGGEWNHASFSVGDLLLFAGDTGGNIVWIIRMGAASQPTDPTLPTEPSQPTVPAEPSQPTEPTVPGDTTIPTEPDEPTVPTTPTDPTLPDTPGSGDASQIPDIPNIPGGITIPSFGGYGGYGSTGDYGTQQFQPEQTVPDEVTVALVTPRNTMTLPVTVDELDLHLVSLDAEVTVTVDALPGSSFTGRITEIRKIGTNSGGSSKFTVIVTLLRGENMLAGMNAGITMPLSTQVGIAIPVAALDTLGGTDVVYTALDETGAPTAPREVTLGTSDGTYVLVTEGLTQGETVYYYYYEALDTGVIPMPQ